MKAVYLLAAIAITGFMLNFILDAFTHQCLAGDEAVFIRITERLPNYDSRAEWFTKDGVTDPDDCDYLPESKFYHVAYDKPVWHHPPVANYLAWPAVKLLMNEENDNTINNSVVKIRWIAWMMMTFCILGALYIASGKFRAHKNMFFASLAVAAGYPLFTHWGENWFYHDMFMLVFLIIALLMRNTKYEKFIYIPLTLMVGCKLTAVFLLIPFVIENRKTILCALILVPYYLQSWIVTGDWLYHYHVLERATPHRYGMPWDNPLAAVFMMIVAAVPFGYTVWNAIKKRGSWLYPALFGMACLLGFGWITCLYQMLPIMMKQ